jgi:hypothetical protein
MMSLRSKTAEDQSTSCDFEGSCFRGLGAMMSNTAEDQFTSCDFESSCAAARALNSKKVKRLLYAAARLIRALACFTLLCRF